MRPRRGNTGSPEALPQRPQIFFPEGWQQRGRSPAACSNPWRGFLWAALCGTSQSVSAADILPVMRFAPKGKSTKLRSWRVSILWSRAHYLGTVEASDEKAARSRDGGVRKELATGMKKRRR
jgi:hypothetical protein